MFINFFGIATQLAFFGIIFHQYIFPYYACAPRSETELNGDIGMIRVLLILTGLLSFSYVVTQFWEHFSSSVVFILLLGVMGLLYRRLVQLQTFTLRGHEAKLLDLKVEKTRHFMLYAHADTGPLYRIQYAYQAGNKTYRGESLVMGKYYREFHAVIFDPRRPELHTPIGDYNPK
jgi:hypothetical protein